MKTKLILVGIIIVLAIAVIFTYVDNRRLISQIEELDKELLVSNNYIKELQEQIKISSKPETDFQNEEERLLKVLNKYLQENKQNENITAEELSKYEKKDRFIPNLIPVKGEYVISQRYKKEHPALDFAAEEGTEVVAAATGEILSVYEDEYFGKVVLIDHLNEYASMYAHLATTIYDSKTFVKKGEPIGLVGNTGNSSAPHLHFEVLKNGENIDPEKILEN